MSSKIIFILLIIHLLFFILPKNIFASILINEISPSTDTEWIELYNDGDTEVNLSGYLLEDGNSSKTDDLNLTGTILPNGFLVFTHLEGWLNNGGDTVKLYNNASPSAIIDQYTYTSVDSTKSVARIPNGSENWQITSNISNNSLNPNPTATPTIAATEVPTSNPTATATATATPTTKPTPTKTPTAKPSPTVTSEAEETDEPKSLSADQSLLDETSPTPTGLVAGVSTRGNTSVISFVLIFLGVGFLGYCGYLLYNMKNAKDKTDS
jgi:hypothetical protein